MLRNLIYGGFFAADVAVFAAMATNGTYGTGVITTTLGALGFAPLAWHLSNRWFASTMPN